ncbi:MAG: hypothetical protein KIT27_04205 [Legionellales bacterium]|nr:hypothetical protein [Legionellales bacterium]
MLTIIPAIFAIFALIVFNSRTRLLCYPLVIFCILAEIAEPIDITAMSICLISFLMMLGVDIWQRRRVVKAKH